MVEVWRWRGGGVGSYLRSRIQDWSEVAKGGDGALTELPRKERILDRFGIRPRLQHTFNQILNRCRTTNSKHQPLSHSFESRPDVPTSPPLATHSTMTRHRTSTASCSPVSRPLPRVNKPSTNASYTSDVLPPDGDKFSFCLPFPRLGGSTDGPRNACSTEEA
jgi:hypothetical protein